MSTSDKNDILSVLYEAIPAGNKQGEDIFTFGSVYVAASTSEGNIGVCATLGVTVPCFNPAYFNIDRVADRVALNALINARVNYSVLYDGAADIFDVVDFTRYQSIVMIGYFRSLVDKLSSSGVETFIFDLNQHDVPVMPMKLQQEYLGRADCVIVSSTSISNGTFNGLIVNTPASTNVYMLGPSTPMCDVMFSYPQVKGLFGSVFEPHDQKTIQIIAAGGGTRQFKTCMRKVYRLRHE
ncbi:MAG TPA: DUF364 domain-containing protein [Tenuifilaceae bacterium]|nr:DUF364 domain-containing protein [Tenuifilaceae bacterium]HQQ30226.1 DUF364 domain-containing protein [Tenuifilaceae bacterium]